MPRDFKIENKDFINKAQDFSSSRTSSPSREELSSENFEEDIKPVIKRSSDDEESASLEPYNLFNRENLSQFVQDYDSYLRQVVVQQRQSQSDFKVM